jgi:hypothetical protein
VVVIEPGAIKTRFGEWLPCAWPQDGLQHDKGSGVALHSIYKAQGLRMLDQHATFENGSTSVEAGILQILDMMRTGRFKVFSHLSPWLEEYRTYHRKDGRIVKKHDHLLDATRVGIMMLRRADTGPSRGRRGQVRMARDIDYAATAVKTAIVEARKGILVRSLELRPATANGRSSVWRS